MTVYRLYGLDFESEIAFPEVDSSKLAPSLRIALGDFDFTEPDIARPYCRTVGPSEAYIYYRNVGAAWIQDARITLKPAAGVDPLVLRLFVLQQVFGVVLLQRGYFLLHSAAAVVNGRAVVFCGPSGAGKSTMAAALNSQGHGILTDDVLAIDMTDMNRPMALPGLVHLKLTDESRSVVAAEIASEQEIDGKRGKRLCAVRGATIKEGVPLDSIYLLSVGREIFFQPIAPAQATVELVGQTYNAQILPRIGRSQSHFLQCAAIARQIPIMQLSRPRDLKRIGEVAEAVVARVRPGSL